MCLTVNGPFRVRFNILIILVRQKVVRGIVMGLFDSNSLFLVDAFRMRKDCGTCDKSLFYDNVMSCVGGGVLCLTLASCLSQLCL